MTRRGALLFGALGLIWGIPYMLIKVAIDQVEPIALVFLRTALAAAILLPIALARAAIRPVLARWRPLLAFTAVEVAAPWLLLSYAERQLSSSLAGLLIAAVPLVGAGLALFRRDRERIGTVGLLGLLLGLAGVGALVGLDVHGQAWAVLEVAGVVVGYAIGPVILQRYLSDLPGLGVMAAALTAGAIGYAPAAIPALPARWPRASVLVSIALLAVLCTAVAFLLLFALVAEVGPVRATVITYINPAVAVGAGVLILDERFTAATAVGFVLVIAGSVLATRRTPQPPSAEVAGVVGAAAEPAAAPAPEPAGDPAGR